MLNIDGAKADDFSAAADVLSSRVEPRAEAGKATMKLLKTITIAAIEDPQRTYTEPNVAYAYGKLIGVARERQAQQESAREECRKIMASQDNRQGIAVLGRLLREQETKLDDLETAKTVVITRGTDPVQTLNISTHRTFGGVPPGPVQTGAPTAGDADRQTGLGVKETAGSRLEEWSLGSLAGFASGGFLVRALTTPTLISLPPRGHRSAGESGVCGFADRGLQGVVILEEGREPIADPFEREIEKLIKAGGQDGTVSAALQESPGQV